MYFVMENWLKFLFGNSCKKLKWCVIGKDDQNSEQHLKVTNNLQEFYIWFGGGGKEHQLQK